MNRQPDLLQSTRRPTVAAEPKEQMADNESAMTPMARMLPPPSPSNCAAPARARLASVRLALHLAMWLAASLVAASAARAQAGSAVATPGPAGGAATPATAAPAAPVPAAGPVPIAPGVPAAGMPAGLAQPAAGRGPAAAPRLPGATSASPAGPGNAAQSAAPAAGSAGSRTGTAAPADGGGRPGSSGSTNPAGTPPAAESSATEDASARQAAAIRADAPDETEFQRFVAQATGRSLPLFGFELFGRGAFMAGQGVSVPASYVLGPGDELVVQVFDAVDLTVTLQIDRNGQAMVPRVGPLTLAGVRFGDAERVLKAHLSKVYRNFNLSVTMGQLRGTEVFVVGQARRPGKHVVSGLSTLINGLFETGGPNALGSLRQVELRRAGRTVAKVDLYRFLAQGDDTGDVRLQPGDVLFIPAAGPRVAVLGSVNVPAIYELLPGETIQQVLALSGGLPVLAAPQKAQLERINPSRAVARFVEDFALDAQGLARPLQAGDVLTVFQISPQIADVVTLQGNVAAPMRYTHRPGMRVADLVTGSSFLVPVSYWLSVNAGNNIPGLDRPEVNLDYATIQRLDADRLRTVVVPFHLAKALQGDPKENLQLQPGDLVRIYGPGEAGPEAFDSVALRSQALGGLRRFAWRPGFTVRDVLPSPAWLREQALRWVRQTGGVPLDGYSTEQLNLDYAVVRRVDPTTLRADLLAFNLGKALAGDPTENLRLQPGDEITVYGAREPEAETLNSVTIRGELLGGERRFVWRPGFTIRDIIPNAPWLVERYNYWRRVAGKDLRNNINWDYGQISRRVPETLQTRQLTFNLGGAVLQGNAADNVALEPGDQITLYSTAELPVPIAKRLRLVTLSGEVRVPGTYQVAPGETLLQVVQRAGGFTSEAYVYGLEFRRESTRAAQQQSLDRLVRRLEMQAQSDMQTRLQNITSTEQAAALQATQAAEAMRLAALRALRATGRVSLRLDPERIALPPVPLEDGDEVAVPARPAFVAAFGAVVNENAMLWKPGMTVGELLELAGVTAMAETSETHILRADGSVVDASQRASLLGLGRGIRGERLQPGDTIIVPERADRETLYTRFIRGAKDITQIFYQFGLGAAAIRTLRN